jgi:hypothetical protein
MAFKYLYLEQRGSYLLADSPADMTPERLRQLLVGALKHGSTMVRNLLVSLYQY